MTDDLYGEVYDFIESIWKEDGREFTDLELASTAFMKCLDINFHYAPADEEE
ncbi:MAG: hypothetical protein ACTSXQ_01950 [Alphaproteobacteria bacterium]